MALTRTLLAADEHTRHRLRHLLIERNSQRRREARRFCAKVCVCFVLCIWTPWRCGYCRVVTREPAPSTWRRELENRSASRFVCSVRNVAGVSTDAPTERNSARNRAAV